MMYTYKYDMWAAEHARLSSHRTDRATAAVFFWLSYAHGLGRAALGTRGEAGRLCFVYARHVVFCKEDRGPLHAVYYAAYIIISSM